MGRNAVRLALGVTILAGCGSSQSGGHVAPEPRETSWLHASTLEPARLIESPLNVTRVCRSVAMRARAQHTALTVFCPPAVPDVLPIRNETACGARVCAHFDDGYLISFWSPTAHWAYNWGGHWTFGAGSATAMNAWIPRSGASIHPVRTAELRIAGRSVTLLFIPPTAPAFYAGHVVATWRQNGLTFHLTVHGFRWAQRLRVRRR